MSITNRQVKFPLHTWVGLAILVIAQILLHLGVRIIAIWLTPIMWTGYILAADGLVFLLRGQSWLTAQRREFPFLALISIGVWLVFEAYNLHLRNWYYLGVPESAWLRNLAYFWSFSTIMPGVFVTIDLLAALHQKVRPTFKIRLTSIQTGSAGLWFILGVGLVVIPLLVPRALAAYLFAPVWIGYILVFDPINQRIGLPSIRMALRNGNWWFITVILAAGLVCGLLWETWNYQALHANGGHWVYTVPEELRIFDLHFGQMPVLGLLGFPPFALELVLIYSFIREVFASESLWPSANKQLNPLLPREFIEDQ